MEVILREEVEKLGNRGDVVRVAAGYARNYLLPKRLAVTATEGNKKIVAQEREVYLRHEAKLRDEAADLAKLLEAARLTFRMRAGENDQLFGSVTAKDIAEELERQNFTIERRKIQLEEPLKTLGDHKVPLRLHRDVTVDLTVHVSRDDEPAA